MCVSELMLTLTLNGTLHLPFSGNTNGNCPPLFLRKPLVGRLGQVIGTGERQWGNVTRQYGTISPVLSPDIGENTPCHGHLKSWRSWGRVRPFKGDHWTVQVAMMHAGRSHRVHEPSLPWHGFGIKMQNDAIHVDMNSKKMI